MSLSPRPVRLTASHLLASAGSLLLVSSLIGCGMNGSALVKTAATPISGLAATTLSGNIHGGQQVVSGATIQLYAVGLNTPNAAGTGNAILGYGTGATSLLKSTVKSDSNGNFSITGQYTCPNIPTAVYLVATGGNPGLTPTAPATTVNNPGIAMMSALGVCPAGGNLLAILPFAQVNELTTVSAVWALQQFMAAPATGNSASPNIGAPNTAYATGTTVGSVQTAAIGLTNAFTTARVMTDITTGLSPNGYYPYATPETAKINTIADILASCINTDPTQSTACANLFAAVTPGKAFTATDTIQAAFYMAQNPTNNLTNIYNLIPANPPFQPLYTAPATLTAGAPAGNAFNDTTIAINYAPNVPGSSTNFAVAASYGIAIDAYGNAWISNTGGIGGTAASVVELGADGSALTTPTTTYTASSTNGSTSQFTVTPTSYTQTFTAPKAVAIDLANRAWFTNQNSVTVGTGQTTSSLGVFTGSTAAGVNGKNGGTGSTGFFVGSLPWGIGVDGTNTVFVVHTASPGTTTLDGASLASITSAPGTATDGGNYNYSTATSATAPNRVTSGETFLAIDTNANVAGGIVWTADDSACKSTAGTFGSTATYYGLINQFSDTNLTSLAGSSAVSTNSGATVGAQTSSTACASTSDFIGQLLPTATANIQGIAIDRNNGVWIGNQNTNSGTGFDGLTYIQAPTASTGIVPTSITLVNGVQPTSTASGVPGTTLVKAGGLQVDGNNNVWVANTSKGSVVEASIVNNNITLLTPGAGAAYSGQNYGIGFVHPGISSIGLAIDPSGNVWYTNNTSATASTYTNQLGATANDGSAVTVIVGAAGPVITPLALAIKANKLGTKP